MKLPLAAILLGTTTTAAVVDASSAAHDEQRRLADVWDGQWFAYFESGGLGPTQWPLLQIADNQCGGMGFTTGYGQSPIAIHKEMFSNPDGSEKCDTDMSYYKFTPGDCTFADLKFSISNNGVKVEPVPNAFFTCSMGKMKIPHHPSDSRAPFKAIQFHVHTSSEHTIEGQGTDGGDYFPAELHIVHAQEALGGSVGTPYTVWGAMIQGGAAQDHPVFEHYLRGWEQVAMEAEQNCADGGPPPDATEEPPTDVPPEGNETETPATLPAEGETDGSETEEPETAPVTDGSETEEPDTGETTEEPETAPAETETDGAGGETATDGEDATATEEPGTTPDDGSETATDGEDATLPLPETEEGAAAEDGGAARQRGRKLQQAESDVPFTPVVDINGITTGVGGCYEGGVGSTDWNADGNAGAFDPALMPNLYEDLVPGGTYGSYTYKGGLTTPACTEIVDWNLIDQPIALSDAQLLRLQKLIWCYVDTSPGVCAHATAASQDGSTSRPPQPLLGRNVTHRCRECSCDADPTDGGTCTNSATGAVECPRIVDTVPDPDDPVPGFQKPPPIEDENMNTYESKCNRAYTTGCPVDKRANPNESPNLKYNAPLWNDLEGYWVGSYLAQDRNGQLLAENFVSDELPLRIPYFRGDVLMFVKRTIRETRFTESITYVYKPADTYDDGVEFCTLPRLEGADNVLGKSRQKKCGETGWVSYAERFGTATYEKDGQADIFHTTGRMEDVQEGRAVPVSDQSLYISMTGEESKLVETLVFTNDERTQQSGSGQRFLYKDFYPYNENPHEETFVYFLNQVSEDDFVKAIQDAYEEWNVPKADRIPTDWVEKGGCIDPEGCPTEAMYEANADPAVTQTPYEDTSTASGWFIAIIVLIVIAILIAVLWYLHKQKLARQKEKIAHHFARRVAETIKIEGSHEQLTPEALEEEFKRIDTDHSGFLDKAELKAFVNSGKIGVMSENDFNALFAALDVDGSGEVNFTEFCAFMASCGAIYDEEEAKLSPEERRKSILRRLSNRSGSEGGGSQKGEP